MIAEFLRRITGVSERIVVDANFVDGEEVIAGVRAGNAKSLNDGIGEVASYLMAWKISPKEGQGNIIYKCFSIFSFGKIQLFSTVPETLGTNPEGFDVANEVLDSQQL